MSIKASDMITLVQTVDVTSVTRYYLLQSSTSNPPSKPTTNPPGGSWTTTEPTYTEGSTNSLYTVDLTVLSDSSFNYSEVSKSSSYEAAKAAYNAAVVAQNTATTALNKEVVYRGLCDTAIDTAAKVVTCENFVLKDGAAIEVTFSLGNSVANAITLNVNGTGAEPVYIAYNASSSTNFILIGGYGTVSFRYIVADTNHWEVIGEPRAWYGTCSTGASTTAKTSTIRRVVVCAGTTVTLGMTNSNTASSPTLNLNSLGAKAIYAGNGTSYRPTNANGRGWSAGSTVTFSFDGRYWHTVGASDGGLKATSYLTNISSDGVFVHPEGFPSTLTDPDSVGVHISDAVNIIRNGTSVASYGDVARIGKEAQTRVEIDYHSLKLIDIEDNPYLYVRDLRDDTGYAELEENFVGDGSTTSYTVSYTPSAIVSVTVNSTALASNAYSFSGTTVTLTTAPAADAAVVITYTTNSAASKAFTFGGRDSSALLGAYSATFGGNHNASGHWTFATGYGNQVTGPYASAFGNGNTARGWYSQANGIGCTAYTTGAYAEGGQTVANGAYSHAQNRGTIAYHNNQTAIGRYNIADSPSLNKYAFIIGNGTADDARSNCFAVGWNGELYGKYEAIAGSPKSQIESCICYRFGPIVMCSILTAITTGGASTGVVPEGCRPFETIRVIGVNNGTAVGYAGIAIASNGDISVSWTSTSTGLKYRAIAIWPVIM